MSAITDWCNVFDRAKIILLFGKLMGFLTQFRVETGQIIGGGGGFGGDGGCNYNYEYIGAIVSITHPPHYSML